MKLNQIVSKEIVLDILVYVGGLPHISVTVGANRLFLKPFIDTGLMVLVFANWHFTDFLFFLKVIAAYRADFVGEIFTSFFLA